MNNKKIAVAMKAGLALFVILAGLIIFSCARESVTYCPFCRSMGVKEISVYNTTTGITEIHYECTNTDCGKTFGAGKINI
ncbi:MAG: ogr/Delta-like zinc finger family protein [Treponema sp.]|nr:ogr/Delta-like zinc finger family protein [Treponema sp.]